MIAARLTNRGRRRATLDWPRARNAEVATPAHPATPERTFLSAEWRDLALLNFEIEPNVLLPHVPPGTEIDLWDGRCFVSVVGFRFLRTRLMGLPIPFHSNFLEVNLRFYVRRETAGELRRGVVFIKEIVPRRAIALVARVVYNENYVALPMRHAVDADSARYEWRLDGSWNRLALAGLGDWRIPDQASEAAFITEHYWGYAVQRDGSTLEYQVEHPRWRVAQAAEAELLGDVGRLYGAEFVQALSREPASAFLADGSEIVVRRGRQLTESDT